MDLSYLFSELLLIPGTILLTGCGYYIQNLHKKMGTFMTEDEAKEILSDKLAVTDVEFEAIKNRLSLLEQAVVRMELKIDDILTKLPKS